MTTNPKYLDFLGKTDTKKISINVEEKLLKMVDDLAELTEANRTVVISIILEQGIPNFVQFLSKGWNELGKAGKGDAKKVKELQEKLVLIKKKWNL